MQIVGFIFKQHNGEYYRELGAGNCVDEADAHVYDMEDFEYYDLSRVGAAWGNRVLGKWVAVWGF